MEMSCAAVREVLPAYVRDGDGSSLPVRRHLSRCADCRTDLSRYADLIDRLSAMEAATVPVPYALKTALLNIPSRMTRLETVRSHLGHNRKAYLSGAAVVVAGAVGAAVWKSRRPVTA